MMAVDTNILVFAHREETILHKAALERLKSLALGRDLWALPIFCLGEFVRVVTHSKLFDPPSTLTEAFENMRSLMESPSLRLLYPGEQFVSFFEELCSEGKAMGNLAFDAQIVAVMREHGVESILTEDRDFRRFERVRVLTVS